MVKVKWKLENGEVYIEVNLPDNLLFYYWFPKIGLHKRFHPRQIFTRKLDFARYKNNSIIPRITSKDGWIDGELSDKIVEEKLGIQILTYQIDPYYDQIAKAC